jgi:hypothetical protein
MASRELSMLQKMFDGCANRTVDARSMSCRTRLSARRGAVGRTASAAVGVLLALAATRIAAAYDVVLNAQGEYLDAYLIDGNEPPRRVVFIDPDPPRPDDPTSPPPRVGRHVNGKVCWFPANSRRHRGQFVVADDTYREACLDRRTPQARCSVTNRHSPMYVGRFPDGWAIFHGSGKWTRKQIHTEWDFSAPEPQGNIDPQGCAFDAQLNFWGTDVGHGGFGSPDGALVVFFPGPGERYESYCFLDKRLGSPGMPVFDAAGNLWVPEPSALRVTRFSPPFPTSAADCANPERLVTTPPTKTTFALPGIVTPVGIANVPGSDHFYLSSALAPPTIVELDAGLGFVRSIVPPGVPLNPLGIGVGSDGTVYYSELDLDPQTFDTRCGRVSRVRFGGQPAPLPPQVIGQHLRFPDGVTVADSRRFRFDLHRLPTAPELPASACGGE